MIGALVVVLVVGSLGYWILNQDTSPPPAPPTPNLPTPSGNVTQQADLDDSADSQLLTSSTYMISTDQMTWPTGDKVWDICRAIAQAEGYNTNGAAYKLNNPGDLSPGDEHGFATAGSAEFHDGSYIIHFIDAISGWNALYTKVNNIVTGRSRTYGQHSTVNQIAKLYAGDSTNWARNVAKALGLDPATQGFYDYVNS